MPNPAPATTATTAKIPRPGSRRRSSSSIKLLEDDDALLSVFDLEPDMEDDVFKREIREKMLKNALGKSATF